MNHASLFSGIGGAEVAASMMGWQNLFHCEIQEFPRKVLDYWFPNAESYEDITKTDFTKWGGKVDVLTGGFPCQPFSLAGRRKGADDNRYLWPEMLRAIRQIHPTWVVGENVADIKTMVESCQVAKMGRTDRIFEESYLYREESRFTLDKICTDLEAEGYSVQPIVIPACAVGAPHRRDRVWIVAHSQCDGHSSQGYGDQRARETELQEWQNQPQSGIGRLSGGETSSHPHSNRQRRRKNQQKSVTRCCRTSNLGTRCPKRLAEFSPHSQRIGRTSLSHDNDILEKPQQGECQSSRTDSPQGRWRNFPTQSPICRGNDGIPFDVDRLTISFARWRQESIKAYGNAWVPQVAYEIFRAIEEISR